MTSTKQPNQSQSYSERASALVAEKSGTDRSIPEILVLFGKEYEEMYLEELDKADQMKTMNKRSKIIALDTVMREIRTTMADEWGRNYAALGYCHIHSPKLDDEIILCRDEKTAKDLKEEKKQKVNTEKEIEEFRNLTEEEMRKLHEAKEIFNGTLGVPKQVGKNNMRNYWTQKKARFRSTKKKVTKNYGFKKSNPS